MDYTINITLSFSELIALDSALQHEAQKLASNLISYDNQLIRAATRNDLKAIMRMIDKVDECIINDPIHNK